MCFATVVRNAMHVWVPMNACLQGMQLAIACLDQGMVSICCLAHERPPSLKSLFINSHVSLRRHQSSLSRYKASKLHFCPLTFLLIPPCKIFETSIQPDPVCTLLSFGSSHGCKATHEAFLLPGLGLKGGSHLVHVIERSIFHKGMI